MYCSSGWARDGKLAGRGAYGTVKGRGRDRSARAGWKERVEDSGVREWYTQKGLGAPGVL